MIDEEFVDREGNYWYVQVLRKNAIETYYENYLAKCDLEQCYARMEEVENARSDEQGEAV